MSHFEFTAVDAAQLEKYLQDDPNDITKGIPHVLAYNCGDVLDIFSHFRIAVKANQYDFVMRPFVVHVFEKALQGIFNRHINILDEDDVVAEGISVWFSALHDLAYLNRDDIPDSFRERLTNWDNGMIACAIIKACGRKLIEQHQSVPA